MEAVAVPAGTVVKLALLKFQVQFVADKPPQIFNLFHRFGIDILPAQVFKGNLFSYLRT